MSIAVIAYSPWSWLTCHETPRVTKVWVRARVSVSVTVRLRLGYIASVRVRVGGTRHV